MLADAIPAMTLSDAPSLDAIHLVCDVHKNTSRSNFDVPNTAARVQALAESSAVLITAQVQRQAAGLFIVEEVAAIN